MQLQYCANRKHSAKQASRRYPLAGRSHKRSFLELREREKQEAEQEAANKPKEQTTEPIPFRDRRSFADKMAADGATHSDIVDAMTKRGVAATDARRHAAMALGDKAQSQTGTASEARTCCDCGNKAR